MNNKTEYSVLIVDDHPLIVDAYKSAFNHIMKEPDELISFKIEEANNCDSGYKIIKKYSIEKRSLDLIFLDIKLPPSKDKKILSGEDLGMKIKKKLPKSKIIISTTFNDNYRIHTILKNINPEGFLIKNDVTPAIIIEAIKGVISNTPFYSRTVLNLLRNEVSNDFILDSIDRKILFELSQGAKMKDLPKTIPLSIAAIEKRKKYLKEIFEVSKNSDRELIIKAKEKGFI